jgi:hypothetical protein
MYRSNGLDDRASIVGLDHKLFSRCLLDDNGFVADKIRPAFLNANQCFPAKVSKVETAFFELINKKLKKGISLSGAFDSRAEKGAKT